MNGCVAAHKEEILSYVDKLREHIKETHIVARKNIGKSAARQKDRYDKVYQTPYEVGEYVWCLSETERPCL